MKTNRKHRKEKKEEEEKKANEIKRKYTESLNEKGKKKRASLGAAYRSALLASLRHWSTALFAAQQRKVFKEAHQGAARYHFLAPLCVVVRRLFVYV